MSSFTTKDIAATAARIADHAESVADELNSADGKLGDGDLGITVSKGWREVADNAGSFPADVGMAFLECSKCFQRASSSSFGTLVATAFMSAAKACKGNESVSFGQVSEILDGSLQAMMTRGKGQIGDKSVLDVMQAMAQAADGIDDPAALLKVLQESVRSTLNEYRDKPNKLGRARMFGEKSIGLDDPGMLAVQETVRALS